MSATLYDVVQLRIGEARDRVAALGFSHEVRAAALARLDVLDRASRTDLSIASRQVERFHADLDAGDVPLFG